MPGIPHLDFPMRLTTGGQFATVDQDSDAELVACIALLLAYPRGSRPDVPNFGVPEQLFLQGGVNLDEIRAALEDYEPRVVTAPDHVLQEAMDTVNLNWRRA